MRRVEASVDEAGERLGGEFDVTGACGSGWGERGAVGGELQGEAPVARRVRSSSNKLAFPSRGAVMVMSASMLVSFRSR
ncbi:MAG TPA: hypothetical protein VL119_00990 [Acidimicrobiia bacterium]|nr:hypothetical protein [Acidimicrobiia bacterium]